LGKSKGRKMNDKILTHEKILNIRNIINEKLYRQGSKVLATGSQLNHVLNTDKYDTTKIYTGNSISNMEVIGDLKIVLTTPVKDLLNSVKG
jgi:hypothetical protein